MTVRTRPRRAAAGLALASCVAAVIAAEGLVRLLAPQPVRPAWDDEQDGLRVARAGVRGRHLQPGKFDVTVSINGQRFRGPREYAREPAPDRLRIAVLGDSMAFGWGAADQDTYPAQLESALASVRPVEVINAGHPGTCMGEKALWYVRGVRPYRPAVVVLTALGDDVDGDLYWRPFSLGGDGRAEPNAARGPADPGVRPARRMLGALPGYAFVAERSQLLGLVRRAATRVLSRERTTALGQRPATPEEVTRFQGGLALLKAEVRWLAERVREDGGRLAVVVVPFRESVYPADGWWPDELRWKSRAVSCALSEVSAELTLPFRDLTGPLAARAAKGPALYHAGVETHPTSAGYRAIAEEVATLLLSEGGLRPQPPAAASAASGPR